MKRELRQSPVIFNVEAHEYWLDEKRLSGITGVLSRQIFADKYDDVPESILEKAKEKGSKIHAECEFVDEFGVGGETPEAQAYIALRDSRGLVHAASEYLVSDEENYATCIDKVFEGDAENVYDIADIKTTYKFDEEYVSWQLSICAYLFETQNLGTKIGRLFGIWLRDENAKLIEVARKPTEWVEELLRCDVNGYEYKMPELLPATITSLASQISEVIRQEKYWSEKKKELSTTLADAFVAYNVKKWEADDFSVTRSADTEREDFDKKAFKADYPELYAKYLTKTTVKGSLRMSLRKS